MQNFKIGIQLYTVREPLKQDFRGTLEALAKMGIQGVELAFYYGEMSPEALADLMQELKLEVCGIYEHFPNLADKNAPVYAYAKALGCKYLTSGFDIKQLKENFSGCVKTAEQACQVAGQNGMTVCYHAHAHEFEKVDDESFLDRLFNEVPAMAFEADTAWIKCGGEDVPAYLQKYADRIPLVHVKDVKADQTITELGNGVIDFKPVIEFANSANVEWVSYEQDISELTPLESADISIKYLKQF